jgi:hypothetical protein
MPSATHALVFCAFLLAVVEKTAAQTQPDVSIFDEHEPIGGRVYYDSSVGVLTAPSKLKLGGPGDKAIILTNVAYTGEDSALLQWTSVPKGDWKLFVARPGFKTANVAGYSNLVLFINGPASIDAAALPKLGLESSPPDVQTSLVNLGDYLQSGMDGDTGTWQQISIPLTDFAPKTGFSLTKLKDAFFAQGTTDNVAHTIWFDDIKVVGNGGGLINTNPPAAPTNLVALGGDRSVVLHWDRNSETNLAGYLVFRGTSNSNGLAQLTATPVPIQSYADLAVTNGQTYFYAVAAVSSAQVQSLRGIPARTTPHAFTDDDDFLEYLQQTAFDYFWYEANPSNGLVRDRNVPTSDCSIAAVGFGLTGMGIAVDHGWVSRTQAAARTLTTLRTFWEQPQGTNVTGNIGYKGWFYHFLDMDAALRSGTTELSSIDTALLLAGILQSKQYFNSADTNEVTIRSLADSIYNRVDWQWMADGTNSLTFGWRPESGFITNRWIGYDEAMILYLLGLGATNNPLSASAWDYWTSGYNWQTNYGLAFVTFPPLFGHQYSHCWVDFRHNADAYMRAKGLTYFENSRRATLAQRLYCMANPSGFLGYGSNVWGLTACDGPGTAPYLAYAARGAPPPLNDDGTIAPTAAAGSTPFTPEYSIPTLRYFYDRFLTNIWTGYGFRDAFNLQANWWDPQVLGIDQGPILIMVENYRSGRVWDLFTQNTEIQHGLQAAGFVEGQFLTDISIEAQPTQKAFTLSWKGPATAVYGVEYSVDLFNWLLSPVAPTGMLLNPISPSTFHWQDAGPPATLSLPIDNSFRFYRVFQLPAP